MAVGGGGRIGGGEPSRPRRPGLRSLRDWVGIAAALEAWSVPDASRKHGHVAAADGTCHGTHRAHGGSDTLLHPTGGESGPTGWTWSRVRPLHELPSAGAVCLMGFWETHHGGFPDGCAPASCIWKAN